MGGSVIFVGFEIFMPKFVRVCPVDDIAEGSVSMKEADGTKLAICKNNGTIYAMSNYCPHMTGNLGEGRIEDGALVCPEHFWRFKLSTGRCLSLPDRSAHTFPVRIEDGWVLVGL